MRSSSPVEVGSSSSPASRGSENPRSHGPSSTPPSPAPAWRSAAPGKWAAHRRTGLELALAVARGIARHPILIVATTRESELLDSHAHGELVGKLAREGERIALRRLDEAATSEWLAAVRFEGNAHEVFRLTEGNPLFVEEATRMGIDRWSAGGVSVMLREHIGRVSQATREILAKASVLGREMSRDDVAALCESDLDAVANAEREALRSNIFAPAKDGWLFSHVLLRNALYDSLAPSARAELHARAAKIARTPAQIASHLLEATSVLPIEGIVEGVAEAARKAIEQHAADDALLQTTVAATSEAIAMPNEMSGCSLVRFHAVFERTTSRSTTHVGIESRSPPLNPGVLRADHRH